MSEPKMVNVVAGADLGCKINLKQLAGAAKNIEYNPKKFNGANIRLKSPRVTALVFGSGKIVVLGAKSEKMAFEGAGIFARLIRRAGFCVKMGAVKINNIVGTVDALKPIDLPMFKILHPGAFYEPELFPGLKWRVRNPPVTFVMFSSGKVNVLGAKTEGEFFWACEVLRGEICGRRI